jgi:hypothetical protein
MSKLDLKYSTKIRYYLNPILSPIVFAFLTVIIFFWFVPLFAPWVVAYSVGDRPGGDVWHGQKEVLLYNQKEKYQVFALGGSQLLQGFPYSNDVIDEYKKIYGEQIDFLEIGFSGQSMSESFLLLSKLPINTNTLIFLHVSPGRISDNSVDECADSRLPLLYNEKYSSIVNTTYDFKCHLRKSRASVSLLSDIVYGQIRAFFKGDSTLSVFNKFYAENRFFQNSNKFVKQLARDKMLQSKTEAIVDDHKHKKVDNKRMSVQDYYKLIKDYVEGHGGTIVLLEMPWNERFLDNNPAYSPENHRDDIVVYNWIVENIVNGDVYSLSRLSEDYYQKVKSLNTPMISLRSSTFYGQDFYDSMHMTRNGRIKFIPKFINILHDEITKIKSN